MKKFFQKGLRFFQKRLKQKICFLAIVFFSLSSTTSALTIYTIGEEITGYEYNKDWDHWFSRKINIWVGKDLLERTIVFFYFNSQSGDIVINLGGSLDSQAKFKNALKQAINWSKAANQSDSNHRRVLGCYGESVSTFCSQTGIASKRGELGIRFFSSENGKNVQIVFGLQDKDKALHKADIYFNPAEIEKFLNSLNSIK